MASTSLLRTLDWEALDLIANHPAVKPFLGFPPELTERVTYRRSVSNPENYAFVTRSGLAAVLFLRAAPGLYHVHTMATPDGRGREIARLAAEAVRFMFMATDCHEIATMIPDGNRSALGLANLNGFKHAFRRENAFWFFGQKAGASYRYLRLEDYIHRSRALETLGETFHARLHLADVEVDHPKDEIHDRWVGAALAMCLEGALAKGVGNYNRWAAIAGYQAVRLVSVTPPLIDMGTAHVHIAGGGLEILKAGRD